MNKCIVRPKWSWSPALRRSFGWSVDPTTIESFPLCWYNVRQAVATLMKRERNREAAPGRLAALEVHSSVRCVQCNSS